MSNQYRLHKIKAIYDSHSLRFLIDMIINIIDTTIRGIFRKKIALVPPIKKCIGKNVEYVKRCRTQLTTGKSPPTRLIMSIKLSITPIINVAMTNLRPVVSIFFIIKSPFQLAFYFR